MTPPTFYPNLMYADAEAAIEWLERTLGFERREVHHDGEGNVVHAEVALEGTVLMLSSAGVGREPFKAIAPGGSLVYVAVDEVDSLYEKVRAAGGEIALELTDTDYGSRDFTVRDPEGTLWAFGTYRPAA